MVFGKKWPKKYLYLTKQFYEGGISIPWQLVTQLVREYFRCETLWLGPSRKGRSLQVMLESTKKNGGSHAFFRDIISPNLAQKRLFLEGTVLNWMQSQHEVLKCNLFTYRFTVNFTVGYLGLSPGSGSLWKNLNLSYQTAFGQETLYFRLTTPRHCLRTRLTGSTIKIASRIRHLWTRFPLLRNDPIMYVSPEFGMTWTTLPTFSHRIWNIKWFLYQLC